MSVPLVFAGESQCFQTDVVWVHIMKHRSDVHFWQHGRIGDSMIVTDEVLINIEEFKSGHN
jgi:hypothetical protein